MSQRAQALALAATSWGGDAALARLDDPDAVVARALVASASPLDREAVVAIRPPHWRECDPSWIELGLGGLDAAARAVATGDRDDPVAVWLARRGLGHLVPMLPPGPARSLAELPRLGARELARTLAAIGRRQLVHAIATADPAEHAAVARRVPWGAAFAAELAAVRSLAAAAVIELGSRKSAAARAAGLVWTDPLAPLVAGARAIAPRVRGAGDLARQIAQRLPLAVGRAAHAELTGRFATAPTDAVGDAEIARAIAHGSVGPP